MPGTQMNPSQEFVFVRSYARWREDLKRRETWPEAVERYISFLKEECQLKGFQVPEKVWRKMREKILTMQVMPSMRALWSAGEAARKSNLAMYSCTFSVAKEIRDFAESLYILCCGAGYGYSVEKFEVDKLPEVEFPLGCDSPFVYAVEDSKEGWADSIIFQITNLFNGVTNISFNYDQIRPAGAKLITMGGRASGPAPLIRLHQFIFSIFEGARGRKLTSLEVSDIMNNIGEIVISGGVRRSSEISFSDLDDEEMRHAKDWPFPLYRSMSNNSAIYHEKPSAVNFLQEWAALAKSGTGERGILNLGSIKKQAPKRRNASLIRGANPCVAAGTTIITPEGFVKIEDRVGIPTTIWNGHDWSEVIPQVTGENQEMVKVTLNDGKTLVCTKYHEFDIHKEGEYSGDGAEDWVVQAQDLRQGMKLNRHYYPVLCDGEEKDKTYAYTQGYISAFGCCREFGKTVLRVHMRDADMMCRMSGTVSGRPSSRTLLLRINDFFDSYGFVPHKWNLGARMQWLAALIDCSGFFDLQDNKILIQTPVDNIEFLYETQRMLNLTGVGGRVVDYRTKKYHNVRSNAAVLELSGTEVTKLEELGLKTHKNRHIRRTIRKFVFSYRVAKVEPAGIADKVYCFKEPLNGTAIFNGIYTKQCGEIMLRDKGVCVHGDTQIITRRRIAKIKDLEHLEVEVWNGKQWSTVTVQKTRKNERLLQVNFSDGSNLVCTKDHFFSVKTRFQRNWTKIKAKDLMSYSKYSVQIEPTVINYTGGTEYKNSYTLGVLLGDGYVDKNHIEVTLYGSKIKLPVVGKRGKIIQRKGYSVEEQSVTCTKFIDKELLVKLKVENNALTELFSWDRKSILKFMAGWADADGAEVLSGGIRIYVSNEAKAKLAQLLLTKVGVRSSVNFMSPKGFKTNYGVRKDDVYYLQITDAREIPCHRLKTANGHVSRFKAKYQNIRSIEEYPGLHDVYCFNEPLEHKALFNNVLTYQCNLSEVVIRETDDLDDLLEKIETATWIGAIQSTFTDFGYLGSDWKKNAEDERLLGVSLTGQFDNPKVLTPDALKAMKSRAIKVAKRASEILGINMPASITTGKPSGCRTAESLITTTSGILMLDELKYADSKKKWRDIDDELVGDYGKVTKTYNNGESPIFEISCSFGMTLKSTPNHLWMIQGKGWVPTDKLFINDRLLFNLGAYSNTEDTSLIPPDLSNLYCNCNLNVHFPNKMSPDLAWLLGYIWGDGAMCEDKSRFRFVDGNLPSITKALDLFNSLFSLKGNIRELLDRKAFSLEISSRALWEFFTVNGLCKDMSRIPLAVRKSSKESIAAFLSGLIDSDGCVSKNKVVITTANSSFSEHIQNVALSIGLVFGRSENKIRKGAYTTNSVWLMGLAWGQCTNTKYFLKNHSLKLKNWNTPQGVVNRANPYKVGLIKKITLLHNVLPTYDVETEQNWFWAGAIMSHNTVSQLVNCASGCHPRYAKFYIRRYRINSVDPLYKVLKECKVKMSPEVGERKKDFEKAHKLSKEGLNYLNELQKVCKIYTPSITGEEPKWSEDLVNTWVVSFPTKSPKNSIVQSEVTAIEQLEHYKKIMENYCEHNQSMTVYCRDEDWFNVGNWVYENWDIINGVSFLPADQHRYELAPFEEISEEEYNKMLDEMPKIDYTLLSKYEQEDNTEGSKELACTGDRCELR
jgi:intein/homing endonuclease